MMPSVNLLKGKNVCFVMPEGVVTSRKLNDEPNPEPQRDDMIFHADQLCDAIEYACSILILGNYYPIDIGRMHHRALSQRWRDTIVKRR